MRIIRRKIHRRTSFSGKEVRAHHNRRRAVGGAVYTVPIFRNRPSAPVPLCYFNPTFARRSHAELSNARGRARLFPPARGHVPHAARAADSAGNRHGGAGRGISASLGLPPARPDAAQRHGPGDGGHPRGHGKRRAHLRLRRLRRGRRERVGHPRRISARPGRAGGGLPSLPPQRGLRPERARHPRHRPAQPADGDGGLRRDQRGADRAGQITGTDLRGDGSPSPGGAAARLPGGQSAAERLSLRLPLRRGRGLQAGRGAGRTRRSHGIRGHCRAGHRGRRGSPHRRKPHSRPAGAGAHQRRAAPGPEGAHRGRRAVRRDADRRKYRLPARTEAERRRAHRLGEALLRPAGGDRPR